MKELPAWLVDPLICVSAEEIALRLQEIRRQPLGAIAVIEGERGGERRGRHTSFDLLDDGAGLLPGGGDYRRDV